MPGQQDVGSGHAVGPGHYGYTGTFSHHHSLITHQLWRAGGCDRLRPLGGTPLVSATEHPCPEPGTCQQTCHCDDGGCLTASPGDQIADDNDSAINLAAGQNTVRIERPANTCNGAIEPAEWHQQIIPAGAAVPEVLQQPFKSSPHVHHSRVRGIAADTGRYRYRPWQAVLHVCRNPPGAPDPLPEYGLRAPR